MSRLLSQEEVDALLASYDAPEVGAFDVGAVPFDLRAPLLLAGESLALVQAACETIAGRVGGALTPVLAADRPVHAEFAGLAQQPSGAALAMLAPGVPLGLFLDERRDPVGGLSLSSELALTIVDRLQGGNNTIEQPRALSPVERRLLSGVFETLTRQLGVDSPLAPLHAGGLDDDPTLGRLAQRGGTLVIASIRVFLEETDTSCQLLMTPELAHRVASEPSECPAQETPARLLDALAEVPVTVEPVIPGGSVLLADVPRIERGRVLQLDPAAGDTIGLRVNGILVAEGSLRPADGGRIFVVGRLVSPDPGR